ncbi:MAG: S-layer homology domain-containing protein [Clostridia bacterium]|nr:S-layer homology domain-containing protein [Clostridia bacterium]
MSIKKLIAYITVIAVLVISGSFTASSLDRPAADIGTTTCEGAVLIGNYTYTGAHPQGDSIFRWYVSDDFFDEGVPVEGADEPTFNATKATVGKFLTFAVVPVDINGTEGDEVRAEPVMQNSGYYEDFSQGMPEGMETITTAEGHVEIISDPLGGEDKVLSVYKKATSSFRTEARLGFDLMSSSQSVVDVYLYVDDISGKARIFGVYDDRYGSVIELYTDKDGKLYCRGGSGLTESSQSFPPNVWNHVVIKINGDAKTLEATINGESIINGSGTEAWRFINDGYNNIAAYFLNYGNGGTVCIKNLAVMNTASGETAAADAEWLENQLPYDTVYDMELPSIGENGSKIYWKSSMPEYISDTGKVTRPDYGSGDADVVLTAYIINGSATLYRDFTVTVYEGTYPPEIRDIAISQNGARPVAGTYKFYDEDGYAEEGSLYQWYAEEESSFVPIDGANSIIFVPGREYDGKNLKLGITPRNEENVYGTEALSEPYRYVYYDTQKPVAQLTSKKLNTDGAFEIEYTYLSPDYIEEDKTEIKWYISDSLFGNYTQIPDASEDIYTPADTGAYYKVSLTPSDIEGNIGEEVFSDAFMYAPDVTDSAAAVNNAIASVSLPEYTTSDIELPYTDENGVYYTWVSSDESVISSDGKISRPAKDTDSTAVTLTLYAVSGFETLSQEYVVTVNKYTEPPVLSDVRLVQYSRPITLEYTFSDYDGDTESNTIIEWYCKAAANDEFALVDGANEIRYAPSKNMDGYIFKARVRPADSSDTPGEWYTTAEHTYIYQSPAKPSAAVDKVIYTPISLTGNYTYENTDGIAEGESEYSWYVSDTLLGEYELIENENKIDFRYSEDYDGKYIKFSVTPKDIEGVTGDTEMSAPVLIEYDHDSLQTFDGENVIAEHIYTGWLAGGTVAVAADPKDSSNKVLQLTRTSNQSGQMTKIGYYVPEYPSATGLTIEADLYQSASLTGVWEMFYICDETYNLHGYKLWCGGSNLSSRGGAAEINGEWKTDSSSVISKSFTKDKWHHIKVSLDYENQMMLEMSLNGQVIQTNLPFRYEVDSTNMITSYIQNNITGTVYMDNFKFTPVYNSSGMAQQDAESIDFGVDTEAVTANLRFPSEGTVNGSKIIWTSSDESLVNTRGKVNRPSSEEGDKRVTLTAHVIKGSDYYVREFDINVMRILTDEEIVSYDNSKLNSYNGLIVNKDIRLPVRGEYGASYSWISSDEGVITNDGKVTQSDKKQDVDFAVTVTRGDYTQTKTITITVAPDYGTNLVIDGGLTSSSSKAANPAAYAIDSDYSTYWSSLDFAKTPYILMDMGISMEVNRMYIADRLKSIKSVRLQASKNKSTWTDVDVTKNISGENISIVEFDKTEARFIRAYLENDKAVTIDELGLFYTESDDDKVSGGIDSIALPVGKTVDDDFEVVTELADGTKVIWTSSNEDLIYFSGSKAIVTPGTSDKTVTLTATVTSGGVSEEKLFTVVIEGKGSSSSSGGGGGGGSSSGGRTSGGVTSAAGSGAIVAAPAVQSSTFTDIASVPWAVEAINSLASIGVVNGTSATTFEPSRSITREEFAAILYRGFGFDKVAVNGSFSDVSISDWYYEPVMQLSSLGIINGVGDGSFGTGKTITRQDMAVMIYRAAAAANAQFTAGGVIFADGDSIADYALAAVDALSGAQIINGVGNDMFNPMGNATRAEATVILSRIMNYIK